MLTGNEEGTLSLLIHVAIALNNKKIKGNNKKNIFLSKLLSKFSGLKPFLIVSTKSLELNLE